MARCPEGHESETGDYCSLCGRLMAAPPRPAAPPVPHNPYRDDPYPDESGPELLWDPDATAAAELCPRCKTPREAGEAYCEGCRWHFLRSDSGRSPESAAPPPPLPRTPVPPPPPGSPSPASPSPAQPSSPQPFPAPPPPAPQGPVAPPGPQAPGSAPGADPSRPGFPGPGSVRPGSAGPGLAPPAPGPEPAYQHAPGRSAAPGAAPPWPDTGDTGYRLQPPRPQSPVPPIPGSAPPTWYVTVAADREYFTAMMARSGPEAASLFFPPYCPERRYELSGDRLRIGRMRHRPNEQAPEIDLARPPEDPGVSHRHALLVRLEDGGWGVVDQGSTNGTTVNGAEEPIEANVTVPLRDGDRVHVGAWTTITVHRSGPPPGP